MAENDKQDKAPPSPAASYPRRRKGPDKQMGVHDKNEDGLTLLHFAAYLGKKKIGEMLITDGADVNAMGGSNQTPLSIAIKRGHEDFADLLRKHGAKE